MLGGDDAADRLADGLGRERRGRNHRARRGDKVIAFKKRRRKNSRRKRGHRQDFALIRITEILTEGEADRPEAEADAKPAARRSGEQKPKAKKTAKKPEAKAKSAAKAKKK